MTFYKETILFSKEKMSPELRLILSSALCQSFSFFFFLKASWKDLANPGKVLFRSLKRREVLCKAILCSGKSNFEGGKAAFVAIFKEKKDSRDCVFWKCLTTLATSTSDKKRTTSLANLLQLCQEKQLHWNIFINYHQLCSSSFTNQK